MQTAILACVEHGEKLCLPSLKPPPNDNRSSRGELRRSEDESKPVGWSGRIWRSVWRFLTSSNQVKWVSATAAIMGLVIFWTQGLLNPSSVSAIEFLTRATGAQNPSAFQGKGGVRRTANQRV